MGKNYYDQVRAGLQSMEAALQRNTSSVALNPREINPEDVSAGAPLILDMSGMKGGEARAVARAFRKLLAHCEDVGIPVILAGTLGEPGDSRETSVKVVQDLWEFYEEYRCGFDLQFHGVSEPGPDPLKFLPDGPPEIPRTPEGAERPEEGAAAWELTIMRRLLATRMALSSTRKVIVNLTYICNNYCSFCAVGNRLHENGDYDFHRKVLEDYRKKGVDMVDFDGGEPTIYPEFLKIIRDAKNLGYQQVHITSNGRTMAYPKTARRILNSGITSLLISCHGANAEVHEEQVQAKGAFVQTIKGIRNAIALKPEAMDFGVNITLTRGNWEILPDYYALMYRLGVRKINVQFLTPFGRAEESLVPDPADIAPTLMALIDKYCAEVKTYLINVPFCFFPGYEEHVVGDVLKLQRNMVFVTQEKVNLFEYLAGTRERKEVCDTCAFSVACEGFYSFAETFD